MFSEEKINTNRQLELDIARGLAVLFMIIIHVQLYFASVDTVDTYFADFNDFVGAIPAAPMFMFLLGVGINYTRKNDPKLMVKRGLGLIFTGYLLNFVRGFVPNIIQAYNLSDISYMYISVSELLYVDILHFSGLAMIMFGAFKKFNFKTMAVILTAIGLGVLNLVLLNVQTDNILISAITGLFWGSNENSFFPFLTWMFYPIAGYVFGSFLIRCTNKKKFYIILAIISTIVFVGGTYLFNVVLKIPNGLTSDTGYYQHFITDNITFTGFVILEIALLSFIAPFVPKFLQKIAIRWSKNVTTIFCIHWVIITWAILFIPDKSLDMTSFILFLIVIVVVSDFLAYYYAKLKEKSDTLKRPTIIYILIATLVGGVCGVGILPYLKVAEKSKTEYVEKLDMGDYEYTGTIDSFSGEPSGEGIAYFVNGDYYEGEFKNGSFNGQGSFIGSEGDKYKGSFVNDEFNGYGEYTDSDGSEYKGNFIDGELVSPKN